MRDVALFVEDSAHEQVMKALVNRLAFEAGQPIRLRWGNTRNGHGAVVRELRQFLRDLQRDRHAFPDLVIVATDGNCKGYAARRREITDLTDKTSARTICAIPDPHVERWLMIDSNAFKTVFGVGCDAPDQKCERDRYKKLLLQAIRRAGTFPSLGGIEYAEDVIAALDIERGTIADASFGHFVRDLRAVFASWRPACIS